MARKAIPLVPPSGTFNRKYCYMFPGGYALDELSQPGSKIFEIQAVVLRNIR